MTLSDFLALDETEQAQAVWNGTFLTVRTAGHQTIVLYELGGFYVEVYYHTVENRIERFRPFRKVNALGPYLDDFNLTDLT